MKSLSSLGLGLSLVFGCLLLALIAELYYLLWWKKRISKSIRGEEIDHNSKIHEPQQAHFHGGGGDSNKDFWYKKPFGEDGHGHGDGDGDGEEEEEDDDDELMLKLQNMAGPTRFLFTIKEETKEDMAESEDGKSRNSRKGSRSRSLSDLFHVMEMEKTPYLTPMASPPYFTPPLTPIRTTNSYYFGSSVSEAYEAEFFNNWLRSSSSSPNFQFLKDAEKKLHKRKLELDLDLDLEIDQNGVSIFDKNEEENDKNREEQIHHHFHHQHSPNTSRVLPLSSSPSSLV